MTYEVVDCGACSACCKRELIPLVEGDDPTNYPGAFQDQDLPIRDILPSALGYFLPHGADGNCAFLVSGRCSIYEKRPVICKSFSCVGFVRNALAQTTRVERRLAGLTKTDVWAAGMSRLKVAGILDAAIDEARAQQEARQ